MTKPQSVEEFNTLPKWQKERWVNEETAGNHIPWCVGVIYYPESDMAITYTRDNKAKLITIYAESIKQAKQRAIMELLAKRAMGAMN